METTGSDFEDEVVVKKKKKKVVLEAVGTFVAPSLAVTRCGGSVMPGVLVWWADM